MNKYKYIFKFKDNKIILNKDNKTINEELKNIKLLEIKKKENEHINNYIWKYQD